MQPDLAVLRSPPEPKYTFEQVASLLDEAAEAAGMLPLEQNPHFVKHELSDDRYRRYRLQRPSAAYVALEVEVAPDAIVFHIDRVPEAVEWGQKQLADRARTVRELIALLSGYLVIENRSSRTTRLTLFRPDGEQHWSFKHTQWPGPGSIYERHLFLPLNTLSQAA